MGLYDNLVNCAYTPEMEFPERTDPNFQDLVSTYQKEEQKLLVKFKVDLFNHYEVSGNPKAEKAFALAYNREHGMGLYAVAGFFEELLPLIVEIH